VTVLVIGAGLAGCVAALELSRQSVDVMLVEASSSVMNGASRFNEGKIHLGYVYAKDPSGRTVTLMQEGARVFEPIVARHLRTSLSATSISPPFDYLVHPDSQMSLLALERRYEEIDAALTAMAVHPGGRDYLNTARGRAPRWRSRADLLVMGLAPQGATAAYATEERAVDPYELADAISKAVDASAAAVLFDTRVQRISHARIGYWAHTSSGRLGPFDAVVNASWASREAIDRTAGIISGDVWNYRTKYFLRVHKSGIGRALPTVTWAVGPFGDIATYGDDVAYLSWYPVGRTTWRTGAPPPEPSVPGREAAVALKRGILSGLARLLPAIGEIDPARDDIDVRGGLIVGNGSADIDDPSSGLHRRDNVGVVSNGGYRSISTGKLTTAPMLGQRAAAAVIGGASR
jgi:glycine/D-amino acid oxidase-like deaminating enzyme